MKRIFGITTFIIVLLVSFLGITYSYEYNEVNSVSFELLGPYKIYLNIGDKYEEYGVKVIQNGVDISSQVNINSSLIDTDKVGKYKVKYEVNVDGKIEYIYRMVIVKEYIEPIIKLNGDEIIYLNLYDEYIEPGYVVSDNYDINLTDKVLVIGNLNTKKTGEYKIEYRVVDSSGNEGYATRKVIVK